MSNGTHASNLWCKRGLAEQWAERAQRWAKLRGEEHLVRKSVEKYLQPVTAESEPQASVQSAADPGRWIKEGVAFIKQRRLSEAEDVLKRAIQFLDQESHGGPIEKLAARAPRALAFNALEALSEVHASNGRWPEAINCGQRAMDLLTETEFEMPFSAPEVHRREGHLCFSMGHVTSAAGGDPTGSWRRASNALEKHGDDLVTAGKVLLQLGLHLLSFHSPKPGVCDDVDAIEEAVNCLGHAADRFARARLRLAKDGPSGSASGKQMQLVYQELEAQGNLMKMLYDMCEYAAAESVLDKSAALLDMVPDCKMEAEQAKSWANLCALWGVTANKLRRLPETERSILIQCRLFHDLGLKEMEMEVLKALAVARRQQRNEGGVEEALASLAALAPENKRESILADVKRKLPQFDQEVGKFGPLDLKTEAERQKKTDICAQSSIVAGARNCSEPARTCSEAEVSDIVIQESNGLRPQFRVQTFKRPLYVFAIVPGAVAVIVGCLLQCQSMLQ